jgi:ADP-ribosylglycohydrolase
MLKKKESQKYSKYIQDNLNKSNDIIQSIFRKKFHLKNKNKIEEYQNAIKKLTNAELINKYVLKVPEYYGKPELILELEKIFSSNVDYVDFVFTVSQIPLYQSLGDTFGYYNGKWEFNFGERNPGAEIVNEKLYQFIYLGGIDKIDIRNWYASDDTILYFETFKVVYQTFIESYTSGKIDINKYGNSLKEAYLDVIPLIANRHPGKVTMGSLDILKNREWNEIPYNSNHKGNGSAMRSGCIGIFYVGKFNRENLIMLAVECSRITHNSAIAILGSVTAALFTSYSIEKIPIELWPRKLLKLLSSNLIDDYIKKSSPRDYDRFIQDKVVYVSKWRDYYTLRFNGDKPKTDMRFLINPVDRYKWLSENFSKGCDFPGGCGDDCLIMAYDALLQSEGVYGKLIVYGMLHPGDGDTIGSIASSWFGGFYNSIENLAVLDEKFKYLEFSKKIVEFMSNMDNLYNFIPIYFNGIYLDVSRKKIKQVIEK